MHRLTESSYLRWAAVLATVLAVLLAATVVSTRSAEAHANVQSSIPGAGDVLAESPSLIEITFTEAVAPEQSDIEVLDVDGERVDLDDTRVVEGEPTRLRVGIEEGLPDGAYTVRWNNLSVVDGHTRSGTFVFFVGSDDFEALAVDNEGGDRLPIGEPLSRWGVLVGLALLAGTPWVFGLVLAGATSSEEKLRLRPVIERIALIGGALVLIAGAAQLALKLEETGGDLSIVTDTRWGTGWVLRMALAAVVTLAYAVGPLRTSRRVRYVLPYLALAAALSVSLTGHGAALKDIALVVGLVDAVHVLAAVIWGGGLVAFLVLAHVARRDREQSEVLRAAIPRFTVLGTLATLTLAVTGSYAAWVHVGTFDAVANAYGRSVVIKVLLLAALVAIAAVNTTWVRGRVAQVRAAALGAKWLRGLLSVEIALIAIVLGVSALLTSIDPARQELIAEQRAAGVVTETEDGGLTIRSMITPGNVGPNRVEIELFQDGEPYEDATSVQLRYVNMEAPLSAATIPLERDDEGAWVLTDPAILSVSGIYEFAVRVQWPEGIDARQAVQFETGADRASALLDVATAWWAGILVLLAIGAFMIGANLLASKRRVMRGERLGWIGAAVLAGALLLWGRGPESQALASNPVPASAESLAAGAEIYAANCARCHGTEFHGDGPDAATLPVRPADLVLHFPQHPDGQHFAVISNGRPASGMPAWEGTLTEEQIWHVINYLRAETEELAPTLQAP